MIVLLATFCVDLSTQQQNETSFARDGKGKTTKTYMTHKKTKTKQQKYSWLHSKLAGIIWDRFTCIREGVYLSMI